MNTENNMPNILLSGFQAPFIDFASQLFGFETKIQKDYYHIIAIGETGSELDGNISCGFIICPQSMKLSGKIKCNGIITCGMNTRCTLSYSSIDYNKALLSVNRRIDLDDRSIHQCEKPVEYYEPLTVYENLVLQGLYILTM
jgi:hypothetical protein